MCFAGFPVLSVAVSDALLLQVNDRMGGGEGESFNRFV